jgi:hypothetical protein
MMSGFRSNQVDRFLPLKTTVIEHPAVVGYPLITGNHFFLPGIWARNTHPQKH